MNESPLALYNTMSLNCKALLFFFNANGILCLKFTESKLSVSNFLILFNLILHTALAFGVFFVPDEFYNELYRGEALIYEKATELLLVVLITLYLEIRFVGFTCVCIQLSNQKKILKLIQNCLELGVSSNLKNFWEIFIRKCRMKFIILILSVVAFKLYYFLVSFKHSWMNFLFLIFQRSIDFIPQYCLLFVFLFLTFFITWIEIFNEEISLVNIGESMQKFEALYEVLVEFQEVFSNLLTLIVAQLFLELTVHVSIYLL
jgi:hypothetical protein